MAGHHAIHAFSLFQSIAKHYMFALPIISGNNSRLPDPVHGAAALGEAVHGGHPLGVRQVAVRVPHQAAGPVVLEFNGFTVLDYWR